MKNWKLGVRRQGFEDEFIAVPNAKRGIGFGCRGFDVEIQVLSEVASVVVLRVKNGAAGLEGIPGDGNHGHAAADGATALKDSYGADFGLGWIGIGAEEVSDGGAADSTAEYAYCGRRWLRFRGENQQKEEEGKGESSLHFHQDFYWMTEDNLLLYQSVYIRMLF